MSNFRVGMTGTSRVVESSLKLSTCRERSPSFVLCRATRTHSGHLRAILLCSYKCLNSLLWEDDLVRLVGRKILPSLVAFVRGSVLRRPKKYEGLSEADFFTRLARYPTRSLGFVNDLEFQQEGRNSLGAQWHLSF